MKLMKMKPLIFLLILLAYCFTSCKDRKATVDHAAVMPDDFPEHTDTLRTAKIIWDKTEKKISHDVYFSEYGRIERLSGDTIMLVYHFGPKGKEWDNIGLRRSDDNGKTWSEVSVMSPDHKLQKYSGFCTPELLMLKNRKLMLAYAGRGIPDDTLHNNLQVRISSDFGKSWSDPKVVAIGRSWEPGMIQLDNGEIQLFFANEIDNKGAKGRPEQQIMMIASKDDGANWSNAKKVAFTPKVRDGMPVPLLLNDKKGIVFFIEAVENHRSPEVIWSSLKANWNYSGLASADNGRRWFGAIDPIWGGAPYALQLPTGETIIAMQTEAGRKLDRYKEWKKNSVVVMVGNSVAKNFGSLSWPYPDLPITEGRYFCSLFQKDKNTIVLVSTRNNKEGRSEIFWKEGKVLLEK